MSKWKIIEYNTQSKEWPAIIKCNSCGKEIVSNSVFDVPFDCPNCGASNLFIQDIDGNFI